MARRSMRLKVNGGRAACATLLAVSLSYLVACQTLSPYSRPLTASLRTDSAEIGVHFRPPAYVAKIGFVYVNTTAGPVSMAGCGGPPDPQLEKKVDGRWVPAYYPFYLACLTKPDFRIESGATYRGVISFGAFEPGHNTAPELLVDSIDGIYRLRWDFAEGTDATAEGVRRVEAVSNEFRMVLREGASPGATH